MTQRYARIADEVVIETFDLDDGEDINDYFPPSLGFVQCPATVEANWQFDGSSYSEPAPITWTAQQAINAIVATATKTRALIADTTDPAKFAEYADKAINAQSVIDGTAPAELISEATTEAQRFSVATAAAMAQIWLDRAAALRTARTLVNDAEREALAEVESGADVVTTLDNFNAKLAALLPS